MRTSVIKKPTLLLDGLRSHPPATLAIYGLCIFIGLISLYNMIMAVTVRASAGSVALAGDPNDPLYELGTSLGFWGMVLFGFNFVLATRWRWVERLFEGLDQVYRVHGLLGRWTVSLILLHLVILTIQALPDWGLVANYVIPGLDLSYTLGGLGLILLTLLVVATLWVRFPYQRWLASHRWMGGAYILGGAHAIVAQGDWYLWLMTLGGGYAWIYSVFLYRRFGPHHHGSIAQVVPLHGVTELILQLEQPHSFQPGQFVWLRITKAAAGLSDAAHPFSLSALLDAHTVRLSAKQLGSYTQQLPALEPGDRVTMYGSYGYFGARGLAHQGAAIWIAGGIGITPFLSMVRHLAEDKAVGPKAILLIWAVREDADAVYLEELHSLAARVPQLRIQLHVSTTDGRLSATQIAAMVKGELAEHQLLLCGPVPMMQALRSQFRAGGVPKRQIISEEFALR
ncbi:MAG: ferric reductase-like transmembrane domain-containing protein [Oscillochloridaceae bacterium umkhey_bin13]